MTGTSAGPSAKQLLIWRNGDVTLVTRMTFDDHALYVLTLSHQVAAIDKNTGTTLWKRQLSTSVPSRFGDGIMLAAGHLIIGDIDLFALDPASGNQVWKYSPSIGAWPGYSNQFLDGNTIFCGSASGHVYAVDAASGTEQWVSQISSDTTTNVYSPLVSGGTVYAAFTEFQPIPHLRKNGGIAALNEATGTLLWSTRLPQADSADVTGVWGDPHAIELTPTTVVAQAADDKFYALDRLTGAIVATLPASTFALGPTLPPEDAPSLGINGNIIIVASRTFTSLSAVSADRTTLLWKDKFAFGSPTRITVGTDRIYSGAAAGQFAAYDLSGKLIWTINRGDLRSDQQEGIFYPAAIDGDRIYVPGTPEVYAFKRY
jgi:outer membrane protein assembly factor BamB